MKELCLSDDNVKNLHVALSSYKKTKKFGPELQMTEGWVSAIERLIDDWKTMRPYYHGPASG